MAAAVYGCSVGYRPCGLGLTLSDVDTAAERTVVCVWCGGRWQIANRPQGPGGPARAYRYRLALRRPYRYLYRRWVRVDGGRRAL